MTAKTITVTLRRKGMMSSIPVPFDPKTVFGKMRAPVKVTLNEYSYRSTIFSMGGEIFIPLRAGHREHVEAVEGAKKPETRDRRITAALVAVIGSGKR